MKRVVVVDEFHETEIRPREDFETYARLLAEEARGLLTDPRSLRRLEQCPACGGNTLAPAFERSGFAFVSCGACRSLFASPRPTPETLDGFNASSRAIANWHRRVMAETALSRAAHIHSPRLDWILEAVSVRGIAAGTLADWQSKYPEFLALATRHGRFARRLSVRPLAVVEAVCREAGFEVVTQPDAGSVDAILAMEVLERAADLADLSRDLSAALRPDGLLFVTTRAASGFDIQVLQARAPNLLPPTHLNLLSVEGITAWLDRAGFEVLELSTPGQLDVQVIVRAAQEDPSLTLPDWVDDLIRRRGVNTHRAFQEFLQTARLSSHLRLVARKTQ